MSMSNQHPTTDRKPDPCQNQKFLVRGQTVTVNILKNKNGMRGAQIILPNRAPYIVPSDLLPCVVGKDSWMKDIKIRCQDCRTIIKASELECNMCSDCYEKAGEENALADSCSG
jgi:hypothetical protein